MHEKKIRSTYLRNWKRISPNNSHYGLLDVWVHYFGIEVLDVSRNLGKELVNKNTQHKENCNNNLENLVNKRETRP